MLAKLFADVHYCGLERINSNPTLIPSLDPEFLKVLNSGPEAALLCRKLRLTGVPRIKKEGMPRKGTDHSCHNRAGCNTVDEHNSYYKLSGITDHPTQSAYLYRCFIRNTAMGQRRFDPHLPYGHVCPQLVLVS